MWTERRSILKDDCIRISERVSRCVCFYNIWNFFNYNIYNIIYNILIIMFMLNPSLGWLMENDIFKCFTFCTTTLTMRQSLMSIVDYYAVSHYRRKLYLFLADQ